MRGHSSKANRVLVRRAMDTAGRTETLIREALNQEKKSLQAWYVHGWTMLAMEYTKSAVILAGQEIARTPWVLLRPSTEALARAIWATKATRAELERDIKNPKAKKAPSKKGLASAVEASENPVNRRKDDATMGALVTIGDMVRTGSEGPEGVLMGDILNSSVHSEIAAIGNARYPNTGFASKEEQIQTAAYASRHAADFALVIGMFATHVVSGLPSRKERLLTIARPWWKASREYHRKENREAIDEMLKTLRATDHLM